MMKKYFSTLLLLVTMMTACAQSAPDTDVFTTLHGKDVTITAIKHGSLRISFDGKEFEIDPVINIPPVTDYKLLPKADYILVTHEHQDHLDKNAIADLEKSGTVLVTNANCAAILGKGKVMRNGDALVLEEGVTLEAVPAYNTTPANLQFHPKGRDNGFVLSLDGLRIYIAGDTEDIPEMKDLKDIDIAFLPTNQPYTMTPEQTARAARIIKPKVLFPYHYGQTRIEQVAELLQGSGIDVRIRNYQ
jgi:L-ascorbate metabolism protein UlaG (beta-lactamase superfamily)